LNLMGDDPMDQLLADRTKKTPVLAAEEQRSFKSVFITDCAYPASRTKLVENYKKDRYLNIDFFK